MKNMANKMVNDIIPFLMDDLNIESDDVIIYLQYDVKKNDRITTDFGASFYPDNNSEPYELYIMLDNIREVSNDYDDFKFISLHTLAHEFRHIYQYKYNPSIINSVRDNRLITLNDYNDDPSEIDAELYADNMIDYLMKL